MPNTTKIPCGGFYLGDGLTMDGNKLKSLGGVTFVKVIQTGDSEYGYSDSSPIKNYEELERSIMSGLWEDASSMAVSPFIAVRWR